MEIIIDEYYSNPKNRKNRLNFYIIEITVFFKLYTRFKVYIHIPFTKFQTYPVKCLDIYLENEEGGQN